MDNELLLKIKNTILDMASKIKFINEKNEHRYETLDGTYLQGVSTISSIIPKDWLSSWGAKEAVKALGYTDYLESQEDILFAKKILTKIKNCQTVQEYIEILKEAKGASRRKSKEALIDGKRGHEWLESYVKAKIRDKNLPIPLEGNLKRPLEQFIEWADKEVDYWILSEALIAYPSRGYAGTLDAMAMMKTGKLAVVDFKFASHFSEDYHLQTAGYQATFEPYDIKIDQRIVIRLPKTLMKEEWDKKEHKYKIVENNLEVRIIGTSYEFDRDTFFACIPVKKWINIMTNDKL